MNFIWAFMIIFSFICSCFSGTADKLSSEILASGKQTVELCLTLLGTLCLWSGLMKIAEESGLCDKIAALLRPVIDFLLPGIKNNKEAKRSVSMNITANLLGLGNAATPLGIEAMKRLKEQNGGKAAVSPDMTVFVVMNTAALKIIPTNVAALRAAAGAENPMDIIFCVWISSAAALIAAVCAAKIFGRDKK